MEHEIGTRITLEVVESNFEYCDGCYFADLYVTNCASKMKCARCYRTDGKNVIYNEVKEE